MSITFPIFAFERPGYFLLNCSESETLERVKAEKGLCLESYADNLKSSQNKITLGAEVLVIRAVKK